MGRNLYRTKAKTREKYLPYLFILPALVFYVIFMVIPIAGTFLISFSQWDGFSFAQVDFIGIQNYVSLLKDKIFLAAIWHNLVFMVLGVSLSCLLALFLAVFLERGLRFSNFFRGSYFIPSIMSMVVIGVIFILFLSPELGLVNPFLEKVGLGQFQRAWLGEPGLSLFTVILTHVWRTFGFCMFLFVAGLKTIPSELYEAADIDGAERRQSFWYITLPLLKPVATVVIILAVINTLKLFDLIYVMTFGGPNHSSEVLTTWMYLQGFMYNNMGYGSAIAVALLLITFALTAAQLKAMRGLK